MALLLFKKAYGRPTLTIVDQFVLGGGMSLAHTDSKAKLVSFLLFNCCVIKIVDSFRIKMCRRYTPLGLAYVWY